MVFILDGNSKRKEQYLLFELLKAFESSHKSGIFSPKRPIIFMRAQYVPSYHLI